MLQSERGLIGGNRAVCASLAEGLHDGSSMHIYMYVICSVLYLELLKIEGGEGLWAMLGPPWRARLK